MATSFSFFAPLKRTISMPTLPFLAGYSLTVDIESLSNSSSAAVHFHFGIVMMLVDQ